MPTVAADSLSFMTSREPKSRLMAACKEPINCIAFSDRWNDKLEGLVKAVFVASDFKWYNQKYLQLLQQKCV